MLKSKKREIILSALMVMVFCVVLLPIHASGEVKPVEDMEQKLGGITEEEQAVLAKLFTLTQEIDGMEKEEAGLTVEIEALQLQIEDLQIKIENKQKDYDLKLEIMKQVLVHYQKGGPASYIEILLGADSLSEFLKSINVIKDISHNVNDLLISTKDAKAALQADRDQQIEKEQTLTLAKEELEENLHKKYQLKEELDNYLASLKQDREGYEEQLEAIKTMWSDCKKHFSKIIDEFAVIISSGYFTMEDLNIRFNFFNVKGYIEEDTFNRILKENSRLSETIFHFNEDQVVLEVPDKHLTLTGEFSIAGDSAIQFDVQEGTFFDMPLEPASLMELFVSGPLTVDFDTIAGDMLTIDITLNQLISKDGTLEFVIIPKW